MTAAWRRWWLIPLAVFVVGRVVSGVLMTLAAADQPAIAPGDVGVQITEPFPASPGYLDTVTNWDGQWYQLIAEQGYPDELPREDGKVVTNPFGFLPLYPMLVRAVMTLTGFGFPRAATLLSMTCAAVASVLVFRLVQRGAGTFVATAVVVALNSFPSAPVLQAAYTESLCLLLVVSTLALARDQRYLAAMPIVLALALTRPVALPLAAVLLLHGLARWRTGRLVRREGIRLAALVALTLGSAWLWPFWVGRRTGEPDAYLQTLAAWNSDRLGLEAGWLYRAFSEPGALLFVVLTMVFILVPLLPKATRALGVEVRSWAAIYPLYMLAVTGQPAGMVRYLLLSIVPLALILVPVRENDDRSVKAVRTVFVVLLTGAYLVGQWLWLREVWMLELSRPKLVFP